MFQYCWLQRLITELERGNKYHICVVFLVPKAVEKLRLQFPSIIHANPVCDAVKQQPDGMKRCLRCRALTFQKARRTGEPFAGYCIHGVYEYCHPVFMDDKLYCMIYVGNLLRDREVLCRRSGLASDDPLLDTMETGLQDVDCSRLARLVEGHIRTLLEHEPAKNKKQKGNAVVQAVQADVDSYFTREISLQEMARLYHYNEKYLGRLFKTQVGLSFGDYLNAKRLEYGAQLLKRTEDSVLEISQKAGFNNVTYFNRLFLRKYGLTPSQYRRTQG